ncbi:MAG: HD domain-containing phosphohydrolase [Oleiphilaceae bacterium]|nr:HD domain-containing phosphohydrolase [Oleiphilaceae bacterium]
MATQYRIGVAKGSDWLQSLGEGPEGRFVSRELTKPDDLLASACDVVVLEPPLLQHAAFEDWYEAAPALMQPVQEHSPSTLPAHVFEYPDAIGNELANKMLLMVAEYGRMRQQQARLHRDILVRHDEAALLTDVGIAMSVEQNLDKLLAKILTEGQRLACCDAASLFLLDRHDDGASLRFKLTKNASVSVAFEEHTIALSESSIVGHCALSGEVLNIADAYCIEEAVPYRFNSSFDKVMGYRTVSLLAIPMTDHEGQVVGVLEFINRKRDADALLLNIEQTLAQVIPFDDSVVDLLRALSSQAAVAIENRKLIDDINHLFDGFVSASVYAIEQRDPCTSGHSFRVAHLSEALAQTVGRHQQGLLANISFSSQQIRELRFAALLHDFGKVGVREDVLVKAKKLTAPNIEILKYRIAMAKQQLQLQYANQLLDIYKGGAAPAENTRQAMDAALKQDQQLLDEYLEAMLKANEPSVLSQAGYEHLEAIKGHLFTDYDGCLRGLINAEEFASLSIARGSLNERERLEIESHVTHTVNFLNHIPWTDELKSIPQIAGAHHEKLDGSGYPNHLTSAQIPYQSRIMTVCDIFDALTASDRPYKPAVPLEKALGILESEAKSGLLDSNVVEVFIDGKVYRQAAEKGPGAKTEAAHGYAHHVCDFDLREPGH